MNGFRNWVHNRWLDNCEERGIYASGERLSEQDYFQQFKWWLRREYRRYLKQQKEQDERRKQFGQWA
jgi:hypothetical protein